MKPQLGTTGYLEATISKNTIANTENPQAYIDGQQNNYSARLLLIRVYSHLVITTVLTK